MEKISKTELKKLVKIARESCPALKEREDLEERKCDSEDFYEIAVWCLKDALIKAYNLGKKAMKEEKNRNGKVCIDERNADWHG